MSAQHEEPLRRVRMSWEEYLALPDWPRAEWVDGEVVLRMPPGFDHGVAVIRLAALLDPLFPSQYLVGEVFLRLPRNRVRLPDLMLVNQRPPDDWVSETPVLVIEVLSRSTRSEDTIRKSREYAEKGIGQYWVVDPELHAIDVWRNVDGDWQLVVRLDESDPAAEVEVDGVTVPLDIASILRT